MHCDEDEIPHVAAGIKIKAILPLQTPPFHLGLSPKKRLALSDPSAWDSWGRTSLPSGSFHPVATFLYFLLSLALWDPAASQSSQFICLAFRIYFDDSSPDV